MAVEPGSIVVGRCYATPSSEVRRVLEIEGQTVRYVVRGKLAFPSWDKNVWQSTSKESFAKEVSREVPCDWRGE